MAGGVTKMARLTNPLNDTQIKQAKAKDKEYNLADGGGLMLRVKPNGAKLWLFNYYKPFSKRRVNISFGVYPDVSLAAARKKRAEARELLADDVDPQEHKAEQASASSEAIAATLQAIAEAWFEVKHSQVTQAYGEDIWRSLQNHIFPSLGRVPIHKITAMKVIDVLKPIAAKGALETVKRVTQRLNEVFVFAVNTGRIHANPIQGVGKAFPSPVKNNVPALKPSELPELMLTLSRASIKFATRCLIEWQLHTMTRPSEAAGTRWTEIDIDQALWTIPPERMKRRREHKVPLSPQAIAILKCMEPISGQREFVFPADRDPKRHANEQTANAALKRMGFQNRLVAHGLRSIASTALNEQGFDPDVIEAALAHVDANEVRRAYNRAEYLVPRKEMMAWWSLKIDEASQGSLSVVGVLSL